MLAICFKNGWIRYGQIDIKNRFFVLNQLNQTPLSTELKLYDHNSPELTVQFHELFQQVVDSLSVPEHEVFLSLGSEWVDCFLLEIDRLLSGEESEDYLNWVFEQRQGVLWEDMIAFFQKIDGEGSEPIQVWACLAMKTVIESIKEALQKVGIDPVWMEPNVQSIMRVVTNAVDISRTNSMVLESTGDTFRAQFQKRSRLKALANVKLRSGKFSPVFVRGDTGFVDQCISDFNRLLENKEAKSDLRIFLTGEFSERHLNMFFQNSYGQDVITLVDPFSEMKGGQIEVPAAQNGSWFVEILGLLQLRLTHA